MDNTIKRVRYAIAGLGHIAQVAVLPAFEHAAETCELSAFITSDLEKAEVLSKQYNVNNIWPYSKLDEALSSGTFDAIYIALPNDMHKQFAIAAAAKGIHVLSEKPLAPTSADCREIINACQANNVKLMVAYRLHFEKTNMSAVELINAGRIGEPRLFNSTFTLQVRDGNIRTQRKRDGGPLNDIGIYCINAARYLFRQEPVQAIALAARGKDRRFAEIEECVGAILRFPDEKLASFICSFGAADAAHYEVIGTEGTIKLENAYEYANEIECTIKSAREVEHYITPKCDQFAPELLHFADCIITNKDPRPSGYEGLNDIRIIEAIRKSANTGSAVRIDYPHEPPVSKPGLSMARQEPAVAKPPTYKVQSGSQ